MRVLGLIKVFLMSRARMGRMVCKQARALRVLKLDLSLLRSAFPSPRESGDCPAPQGWVGPVDKAPRCCKERGQPALSSKDSRGQLAGTALWRKDRAGTQATIVAGHPLSRWTLGLLWL